MCPIGAATTAQEEVRVKLVSRYGTFIVHLDIRFGGRSKDELTIPVRGTG